MKTITLLQTLLLFATFSMTAQDFGFGKNVEDALLNPYFGETLNYNNPDEECDDVITCENLENGVFITGPAGQKAAIDIPIDANTEITINQIKVTLSSGPVPSFVDFKFYKSNDSIPTDIYREINDATIIAVDSIGYVPTHQFVIRNVTLQLAAPIVLNGSETTDRFWMSPISDANAWATTDGVSNGAGITGKAVVIGGDNFDWFELGDIEGLYEIDAECTLLGVADQLTTHFSIYPNPANNKLNIQLDNTSEIVVAEIYNSIGQKISEYKNQSSSLDISFLGDGLYFLKIQTDKNQVFTSKFVVKN